MATTLRYGPDDQESGHQDSRMKSIVPSGKWTVYDSRGHPRHRLAVLYQDIAVVRAHIEKMLEELADRHGIGAPDVTKAMDRHADKLLDVAVSRVRRQLERKIKAQDEF
jgi:hypothetical protein